MSKTVKLDFDGQSVQQADYNLLGTEASSGEDRVYAELFRLTPGIGTIARGVLPYGSAPTMKPNGASGSILVNPFRVLIGTRTAASSDAVANWQDVRSAISIADGSVALAATISFSANASGSPRWDAVYAVVGIDSASVPTTRKVKNPGSGVVTDESVSVYSHTTVSITTVTGTPNATPTFPAIPTDTGSTFYVLLGYVRIPDGFTAGSVVGPADINFCAPVLVVSATTGAGSLRPANQNYLPTGTQFAGTGGALSKNGYQNWLGTANQRPAAYIPSSMVGSESLVVAFDLLAASSTNWSVRDGDVIDDSRDWRNRICRWSAMAGNDSSPGVFPWGATNISNPLMMNPYFFNSPTVGAPSAGYCNGVLGGCYASGMGASFVGQFGPYEPSPTPGINNGFVMGLAASGAASQLTPAAGMNMPTNAMVTGSFVGLYVDASTGALKIRISSTAPRIAAVIWIDFSAQFANYPVV